MRRAKESKRMNGFDSDSYSLAVCVCRYCRWRERVFRRVSLIPLHRAADSTLPNVTYCAATKRAANRMCSMCVCVNEMNILCCTFFPCLLHWMRHIVYYMCFADSVFFSHSLSSIISIYLSIYTSCVLLKAPPYHAGCDWLAIICLHEWGTATRIIFTSFRTFGCYSFKCTNKWAWIKLEIWKHSNQFRCGFLCIFWQFHSKL